MSNTITEPRAPTAVSGGLPEGSKYQHSRYFVAYGPRKYVLHRYLDPLGIGGLDKTLNPEP